jgi:pimeloyl-ACP methyl ester carboxylesterase
MQIIQTSIVRLAMLEAGSGIPVLFVHGFPLSHAMWRPQIEGLAAHCRVIAPDLRGFGESEVSSGKVTLEQFADDLAALVDCLGVTEPVVFCGLSMGGYIAWPFWRKHRARVRAMILCDTRAVPDAPEAAEGRRKMADRVEAEGPQVAAEAMLPKFFAKGTLARQPHLEEFTRQTILANSPQGIAAAQRGMAEREDATGLLASIDVPTLVLVGTEDVISTPDEMRNIANALPHAQFVEVPDAGHMATLENPGMVNGAMQKFLARLSP